jgi:hypothetical protein
MTRPLLITALLTRLSGAPNQGHYLEWLCQQPDQVLFDLVRWKPVHARAKQ